MKKKIGKKKSKKMGRYMDGGAVGSMDGYMAVKSRKKARGGGAAQKGTSFTSYT